MSQNGDSAILITGGAGYIGSHIVKTFIDAKLSKLIVLDDLSTGFADSLPKSVNLVKASLLDKELVAEVIRKEKIKTVIHLAAKTVIPDSIKAPLRYYENNTVATLHLLEACLENQVSHFIYSSTAAVYGNIKEEKIAEDAKTRPTNPYGYSKLMSEQFLKDIAKQSAMNYVILRYFNVAGAAIDGQIGQRTLNATHLIKVAAQVACKQKPYLSIFGDNYDTPDGTCIRDFIHVSDLAKAHLEALSYLQRNGESCTLNCGYGHGFSVKEVIKAFEAITKEPLPTKIAEKREGDLAVVIADNTKIKQVLNWKPDFDDLALIVETAYEWEKKINPPA